MAKSGQLSKPQKRSLEVPVLDPRLMAEDQDGDPHGLDLLEPKMKARKSGVTLFGFDDDSDDEDYDDCEPTFFTPTKETSTGSATTATGTSQSQSGTGIGKLSDPAMFDPLAEEAEAGQTVSKEQQEFLAKYFVDPAFMPGYMETLSEERPAPDLVNQAVRRPMDPEIMDLMNASTGHIAKGQDKGYLSTGVRLGAAVGPLCDLWTEARLSGAMNQPLDGMLVARRVEETLIGLGQVNAAILFNRRKNLLAKFMRSNKKAALVVTQNHKAFQAENDFLFGEGFHEALYKKAKGSQHLREAKREFNPPPQRSFRARGRGFTYRRSPLQPPMQTTEAHYGSQAKGDQGNSSNSSKEAATKPFRGGPSLHAKRGGRGKRGTRGNRYVYLSLPYKRKFNWGSKGRKCYFWQRGAHRPEPSGGGVQVPRISPSSGRASRGQPQKACTELAVHNKGSLGVTGSTGVSNRMDRATSAIDGTQGTRVQGKRSQSFRCRSSKTLAERGDRESDGQSQSVCRVYFPEAEERRIYKTDLQPKTVECLYPLRAFQNGGSTSGFRNGNTKEFFHKIRPKRCLSISSHVPQSETVSEIPLEQRPIPVQSLPIRVSISAKTFHQDLETGGGVAETSGHPDGDLSGRHDLCKRKLDRVTNPHKFGNVATNPFGFCGESREINQVTNTSDRISWVSDKCPQNDNCTTTGQGTEDTGRMQQTDHTERNNSETVSKIDRTLGSSSEGSTAGTSALPEHADVQDSGTTAQSTTLRSHSTSDAGMSDRTDMVERRIRQLEWSQHYNTSTGSVDYDRCLQERLGGNMRGNENAGSVVSTGGNATYQYPGTNGSQFCSEGFCETKEDTTHTCEIRQYSSGGKYQQNGGNQIKRPVECDKGSMVFLSIQTDHNYSGTPPGSEKPGGRPTVTRISGLQQLEAEPEHFQGTKQDMGTSGVGSFCRSPEQTDNEICELESRSRSPDNGCFLDPMEGSSSVCISTILLNREMFGQNSERRGNSGDGHSSVEHSTLVQQTDPDDIRSPQIVSTSGEHAGRPTRGETPIDRESDPTNGGMAHLRQSWNAEGFSEAACDLLGKSRRQGTQAVYNSAWRKWSSWCLRAGIDPFQATLADIINYLSSCHDSGLEYATLNGYRAAISAYHPEIDGHKIGQHPLVKQLLTGAFNERPPQPKYADTWDVNCLLTHIRNMQANEALTDKDLTMKTVTLLTLAVIGRAHEIRNINPQLIEDYGDRLVIRIAKLTKTKRPAKADLTFTIGKFDDSQLDVVTCVRTYLNRTASWRNTTETKEQMFLALVKPHKPVSVPTISRWLKDLMKLSGIDTEKYKAHSLRSAAVSKASQVGMSVEQILEKANWSKATTFHRFYCKQIKQTEDIQQAILQI